MIASLRGKILQVKPFYLHLEVQGIGYGISIPLDLYDSLKGRKGEEAFLYTEVIYREDAQTIFGFSSESQVELFRFLLKLQGIGAKVALNLISTLGDQALLKALINEEEKPLTGAPRVGKAKAEKIVFESRTRKKKLQELVEKNNPETSSGPRQESIELASAEDQLFYQVEEALASLGFQKKEIDQARARIQKNKIELPELVADNLQQVLKVFLANL